MARRREPNVATRAKLTLEGKYQKDVRWSERRRLTKSMAEIKRDLAAPRQM